MKSSKAPVIVIALVLIALIAIPLVIFFAPVGNGGRDSVPVVPGPGGVPLTATDNDLRSLLNQAESLVEDRMSAAVRSEQLGLDRYQRYRSDLDRARELSQRGRVEPARERLQRLIQEGEAEMTAIESRAKALASSQSIAGRLRQTGHLASHFQSSYEAARKLFDEGQSALQSANYARANASFDAADERLDALEESAQAQAESWLQTAQEAVANGELGRARQAFEKVLSLVPGNNEANAGLAEVEALLAVESQLQEIRRLEQAGDFDAALDQVSELLANMPDNPLLQGRQKALQEAIRKRDHAAALEAARAAAEAGDWDEQIAALERALDLIADQSTLQQLREAVAHRDQLRLETLLADAFASLRTAEYASARELYREALVINPESAEAKEGLERSARLLIAEIEFRENLASAQRLAGEGRFPMAASFFNRAMATRPANLPESDNERNLRNTLERQSKQVAVTLRSDNQTHVSIVGVFPPERFRTKELTLYPDVYRVRGSRRGQPDVEMELRVSVDNAPVSLTVIAYGR
jgi:tetratricopeptide (TPR) repeat protein